MIFEAVLRQTYPRFHCRRVGPPLGDFTYWKSGQGPVPPKMTSINS